MCAIEDPDAWQILSWIKQDYRMGSCEDTNLNIDEKMAGTLSARPQLQMSTQSGAFRRESDGSSGGNLDLFMLSKQTKADC